MQAIWKFTMQCIDKQIITLPKNAKILCIQIQNEIPCMFVINPNIEVLETKKRTFVTYGTGHQHKSINGIYIGTYQLYGLYHVFEI